jgi:hypothetical protein
MKDHPGRPPSERRSGVVLPDLRTLIVPATSIERIEILDGGEYRSRTRETQADLDRIDRDRSLLSFVGMASRPGVAFFGTYLEYTFYPPGRADLNALFQLRVIEWEGMYWVVATIPARDREKAEEAAIEAELAIKDGVPSTVSGESIAHFPLGGRTTFTLESVAGAPIYRGQLSTKLALAMEEEECDEIVAVYKRLRYRSDRAEPGA